MLSRLSNSDDIEVEELNDEQKETDSKYIFDRALGKFKNNHYKKAIKYIDSVKLNDDTSYYWQILYIKLLSYQEIIEKKFLKYYNTNEINKIEKYLIKFNKILK